MSSAIRFNLDQSKILSSGNGLKLDVAWKRVKQNTDDIYVYITFLFQPTKKSHIKAGT